MIDRLAIKIDPAIRVDHRVTALMDWLAGITLVAGGELRYASDDASFRRYFRIRTRQDSFIVMDAPPVQEDCRPYLRIARFLTDMGLQAPKIVEANADEGFLLLTDLGSTPYLDTLQADPSSALTLYTDALNALQTLQQNGFAFQSSLPPYEAERFRMELSIFRDWLCEKHLSLSFSENEESRWQELTNLLVRNALDQPSVFVHRDFHSRNLMLTEEDNPGILDFQDALEGPLTYDLVSLLKDCYFRLPAERVQALALGFYSDLDESTRQQIDQKLFIRYFDLMGVQRHLKAAGIFARLNHRDGKSGYMADIPRTLSYIVELAPRYPELGWLVELISTRCLPALEGST